jgi:hypothetical protein
MAWERRARGGLYYTRSRKVGGRVVREYVGGGLRGELAAAEDARCRAERKTEASAWHSARTGMETLEAEVVSLDSLVQALVNAALMVSGYRRHGGEWRRPRAQEH